MTDRELLEAAAKAIGKNPLWYEWDMTPEIWGIRTDDPDGGVWNPLTDDGDALRLAVKLRICIEHVSKAHGGDYGINAWPRGDGHCGWTETSIQDYAAATRRAIVRAAAEIGKAQP